MTGRIYYKSLHAEMNALFKSIKYYEKDNRFDKFKKSRIRKDRPSMTIYVSRLMKGSPFNKGEIDYPYGCSKPCKNCEKYLAHYNISKIKYTDIIDNTVVLCEMRLIL